MAETHTLSTAITKPNQTTVLLTYLQIDIANKSVGVFWSGENAEKGQAIYPTPAPADHPAQPTGAQLITTLNTANLTSNSLVRRVLTRLQTDGYIPAGTVGGTPD